MDLEAFRWLLTDAGQRLLDQVQEVYGGSPAKRSGDLVALASAVRRMEPDADRAAAALTTVDLRHRAVSKFGADAATMYFTVDGLEQSTRARSPRTGRRG